MAPSASTERRKWALALTIAVAGWAATIAGFVWWSATSYADVATRSNANAAATADHEQRLRTLEEKLAVIGTDVKWIRETMEGKKP